MGLIEKLKQIERIDALIRRKATGTPGQLAKKLRLSERQVYNVIKLMKDMGAPIFFCPFRKSYCYEYEVEFRPGFLALNTAKIGGGIKKYINSYYLQPTEFFFRYQ
ncbi:MAG: HTH domain-containing protein [Bacteroidota bacterium]